MAANVFCLSSPINWKASETPTHSDFFHSKNSKKTVSSVKPPKLTQFQVIPTTKGIKRSEKLKKGQKNI